MRISCRGAGAAVHALSSGEVQLMFPGIGSVKGHILSDKLRALTMTSPQPSALAPELPTMAASGLPGYESISYTSMVASAKMPSPIINTRQQTITRALRDTLAVCPPLIITEAQIDELFDKLTLALDTTLEFARGQKLVA